MNEQQIREAILDVIDAGDSNSPDRGFDCCGYRSPSGKGCGALRYYHDDGSVRTFHNHKFVEPARKHEWQLQGESEAATDARMRFCDAVIAKLKTSSLSPEDATKLESATIGERFNHAHFEDVLRAQKQVS